MEELWARLERLVALGGPLLIVLVAVTALAALWLTRVLGVRVVRFFVKRSPTRWDDMILEHGVIERLAWLSPGLVIRAFAEPLPGETATIHRIVFGYLLVILLSSVFRLLSAVQAIYESFHFSGSRPIKGYVQIVKIFLVIAGGLIVLATLLDESPWVFISGLGAATAVLLLVFRDTILSFIASLQIAAADLVRIGDWITVSKYGADGDVVDIALHTIKVQNWDKTISVIPTYALIEGGFKNWRGMTESGGRRIARAIAIDQSSVRFLSPDLRERLNKVKLLTEYIESRTREIEAWNQAHDIDASSPMNGRRMTNIGTLRIYLTNYLRHHPSIHKEMTLMVRQLEPSEAGLPIQLYCFTNTTQWTEYERIQADIFDHVLAILPEFGLLPFQKPSGGDVARLAQVIGSERAQSPVG